MVAFEEEDDYYTPHPAIQPPEAVSIPVEIEGLPVSPPAPRSSLYYLSRPDSSSSPPPVLPSVRSSLLSHRLPPSVLLSTPL